MSFHCENQKYRSIFPEKIESNFQNLRHPKERTGKVFCPQIRVVNNGETTLS